MAKNILEPDLFSFWSQLVAECAASTPLPAAQDAAVDRVFRARLCASSLFAGLADVDWSSFTARLSIDSSGSLPMPTAQYEALKLQLRATLSGTRVAPINLSNADLLSYLNPRVGVNFGALMPGCVLYLRGDLGLGLTGSVVNTWTDQKSSIVVTEGSAGVGVAANTGSLNGHGTLISNGTTHYGTFSGLGLSAPATTNFHYYAVHRFLTATPGANGYFTGANDFSALLLQLAGQNNLEAYNGTTVVQTTAVNTWARTRASFTGSTGDVWRWGSTNGTGASWGNQAPQNARGLFADQIGAGKGNWETALFLVGIGPIATFNAALATLDAAVTSFYGAGVLI